MSITSATIPDLPRPVLAPEPDFRFTRDVPVRNKDGGITMHRIKDHAKIGVRALLHNPYFALFDEMGGMKTAQAIIATQYLHLEGKLKTVIVVAPNSVIHDVWYDQELGELNKHLFINAEVCIYHSGGYRVWRTPKQGPRPDDSVRYIITNYEFVREKPRRKELYPDCGKQSMLVLDESIAIRNYGTAQTKACLDLRSRLARVVLLNGTPYAGGLEDLYSQGNMMHEDILECTGVTHFRARYMEMKMSEFTVQTRRGRIHIAQPTGEFKNIEDLERRFSPYVLRRLKSEFRDYPEALPVVPRTVPLSRETWAIYTEMRDEMVAWLEKTDEVSVANYAITKFLRLTQITSGFIGGVEKEIVEEGQTEMTYDGMREIGREKLDSALEWIDECLMGDPNAKLLLWCKFVPELRRLLTEIKKRYKGMAVGAICGQSIFGDPMHEERSFAQRLFHPQTAPRNEPGIVGGTYGTGALGINLTACYTVLNISSDAAHWKWEQTMARVDRPGQTQPVSTMELIATGPKGQKTYDHIIAVARKDNADMAHFTTRNWVTSLRSE